MENFKNKWVLRFKLHVILSSEMKSHAILTCPTWDENHPFDQHIPPASHSAAVSVIRSTVSISQCLYPSHLFFFFKLIMALKHKSSDSGNLDVSKPSCKVLPLIEKVKVLNEGKKKSYTEVAKIHSKNKSSIVKLWRRKKKSMLAWQLHLSSKSYSHEAWPSVYLQWKRH